MAENKNKESKIKTKEIKSKKDELSKIIILEDEDCKIVLRTDKEEKDIDKESIIAKHKKIVSANSNFIKEKLEQLK